MRASTGTIETCSERYGVSNADALSNHSRICDPRWREDMTRESTVSTGTWDSR